MCSYYRRFIENFATIARPLTNLNRKNQPFIFGDEEKNSYDQLRAALMDTVTLAHPDYNQEMEIHSDASSYGLGAVLVQRDQGVQRPLAFASRLLTSAERNYTITEQECLAIVWALKKFQQIIWGDRITVLTDHHALCWLLTKRDLTGRLARWSLWCQGYDLKIVHKSGKMHTDADPLSRYPIDEEEPPTEEPVQDCAFPQEFFGKRYCWPITISRSQATWGHSAHLQGSDFASSGRD